MNKSLLSFTFFCIFLSQVTYTHSIDEMLENAHNTKLLHEKVDRFRKFHKYANKSCIISMITGLAGMLVGALAENHKVVRGSMCLFFSFIPVAYYFQRLAKQEIPTIRDVFILLASIKTESGEFVINDKDFIFLGSTVARFSDANLMYIAHKLGRNIPHL